MVRQGLLVTVELHGDYGKRGLGRKIVFQRISDCEMMLQTRLASEQGGKICLRSCHKRLQSRREGNE